MAVSQRIKYLRRELKMTQAQLAEALGICAGTIALWEQGKRNPAFDMLDELSRFFNVSMDYLIGNTEDRTPREQSANTVVKGVENEYQILLTKYMSLDNYGKTAVNSLLNTELMRCMEQNTVSPHGEVTVSLRD